MDRYGEELQLARIAENMLSLGKKQTKDLQGCCFETRGFAPGGEKVSAQGQQHAVEPQNSF